MQAVILAAGMGKRLQELTENNTKCMVKVSGITLVERMLRILDRKNLSKIVIVVGYKGEELIDFITGLGIKTPILYIDNPVYHKTNNIYSLSLASEYLKREDTLLFESDLIFEESIVDELLADERESLAVVDKYESWMDGTCMILDGDDNIVDFISGKHLDYVNRGKYYKTVNIYKFSQHFSENVYVPFLDAYRKAMGANEYYESVIKLIAMLGTNELKAKRLDNQVWYEIDDIQDLDIAETLFPISTKEQYIQIAGRFGGYWRYPKLVDFCYLVNPYFPTPRMMDEMKANFATLVTNYPSGMSVNSLLAGRNFKVKKEHIVIGNGAAELIKAILAKLDLGRLGLIRPTFEEYPNRYMPEKCIVYSSEYVGFQYTASDLMRYFTDNPIDTLVLINPDNPSGNYIKYTDLLLIIDWAKKRKIQLIIDESFADFAEIEEGEKNTIIDEKVLTSYDKLYVVKSISKSYGVPGIRLGVLASSDEEIIKTLKKEVSIWNINSFGEFFMQIYEKYEKEYKDSLKKIISARKSFADKLEKIPYLRVIPSQANYIMCEVTEAMDCDVLAEKLLRQEILIKSLKNKVCDGKQYIRLSVKTVQENNYLISCLEKIV